MAHSDLATYLDTYRLDWSLGFILSPILGGWQAAGPSPHGSVTLFSSSFCLNPLKPHSGSQNTLVSDDVMISTKRSVLCQILRYQSGLPNFVLHPMLPAISCSVIIVSSSILTILPHPHLDHVQFCLMDSTPPCLSMPPPRWTSQPHFHFQTHIYS